MSSVKQRYNLLILVCLAWLALGQAPAVDRHDLEFISHWTGLSVDWMRTVDSEEGGTGLKMISGKTSF